MHLKLSMMIKNTEQLEQNEKKNINEKPISHFPVGFREAISAEIKVESITKEEKDKIIDNYEKELEENREVS